MEFEIIKLVLVFLVIVAVMWAKKPLWIAVIAASFATVLLYGLKLPVACAAAWKGATARSTLETMVVFYSITFLQRMMEKRGDLNNSLTALNGLFNNNRINSSIVPFMLGMLPAAGTVVLCGPIVRESTKDSGMSVAEKASITSYYRHISESFLPTYPSIFVALALTQGRVGPAAFVIAMLPVVAFLMLAGWAAYLRRIPKDTGMRADQPKSYYWKLFFRSIWSIGLTIALILVFDLRVYYAVCVAIVLHFIANRFTFDEIRPFFRSAFEARQIFNVWFVLIFKEVLAATGVITLLPAYFSTLPIPDFLIFTLVFFFGTIVAGSQAIIVLCIPMAMQTVAAGHSGLALFSLMMSIAYIAMQLSPTHICLTLCSEDYKISLGALIWKTFPMVALFIPPVIAYYLILNAMGF